MPKLITAPNLPGPDDFYAALLDLYEGRSREQCVTISAKLILLLANHVGDEEAVREAIAIAASE
jgi:5-carboxymethyl-2-hydroxymuconate isomerase